MRLKQSGFVPVGFKNPLKTFKIKNDLKKKHKTKQNNLQRKIKTTRCFKTRFRLSRRFFQSAWAKGSPRGKLKAQSQNSGCLEDFKGKPLVKKTAGVCFWWIFGWFVSFWWFINCLYFFVFVWRSEVFLEYFRAWCSLFVFVWCFP